MIRRNLIIQGCHATRVSTTTPAFSARHTNHLSSRLPAPARARIMSRWYSSAEGTQNAEKTGDSATDQSAVKDDPREKELQAKSKEIVDLKDKYLRTVADYRNLQEQTRREVKAAKDFALQKFARDLIESVDNLDLAIQSVPAEKLAADDAADLKQLHGGLKMTETILMNTLKKYGMERFDPSETAARFDPNLHEATFQTPQPGKEDGTVFHTTSKGFTLNGRVLRAAKVGVVRNT